MNVIAERLREMRDANGYSQVGLGASVGMGDRTWSKWENDPPSQLLWLAEAARKCGYSADYLLGLTDDPAPAGERDWPEGATKLLTTVRELSVDGLLLLGQIAAALSDYEQRHAMDMAGFDFAEGLLRVGADEDTRNTVVEILRLSVSDPAAARALALRSFSLDD